MGDVSRDEIQAMHARIDMLSKAVMGLSATLILTSIGLLLLNVDDIVAQLGRVF